MNLHSTNLTRIRKDERGNTLILGAVVIVALIGVGAFAIDIGSALVTKAELQNTADASVLAGTRKLADIYASLGNTTSYKDYTLTGSDKSAIAARMATYSTANKAGGVAISILTDDTVYGKYDNGAQTVVSASTGVKAVKVKTRRDDSANGTQATTLAKVLGIQTLSITATSAAQLSAVGGLPGGGEGIPVGISQVWFDNHSCQTASDIKFNDTHSSCAAWHVFRDGDGYTPPSASRLRSLLDDMRTGAFTSPGSTAGETRYEFTGGTVASAFDNMVALYDAKKDASGNWDVLLPVYQESSSPCKNQNTNALIIGYAKATIYGVTGAPDKTINANVRCGVLGPQDGVKGGGTNDYGALYSSPGMVQ